MVGYPVLTNGTVKEPPLSLAYTNRFWDILIFRARVAARKKNQAAKGIPRTLRCLAG